LVTIHSEDQKKGLQDDNDTKALKAKKDAHNTELSKAFGSLSNSFGLPMNNGYKTLSMMIIEAANKLRINCSAANVVEVGSGVGGLTTTLAQSFKSVVGIDHHHDNVTFSKKVWDDKKVAYHLEGEKRGVDE